LDSRQTEISLTGSRFGRAGISLDELLPAFDGEDVVWYSSVYGDHDDNVLMLAVDLPIAETLDRLPPDRLVSREIPPDNSQRKEYQLTDGVADHLGVCLEWNSYSVERCDLVRYEVYSHDDWFFSVEPVDDGLLKRLLRAILRLHKFRAGEEIDWSAVLDPIRGMLLEHQRVWLKSIPRRQTLNVSWETDDLPLLARLMGRKASRAILVENGQAHFTS
jgi:hypothetical protein